MRAKAFPVFYYFRLLRSSRVYNNPPFGVLTCRRPTSLLDVPRSADVSFEQWDSPGGETMNTPALLLAGICAAQQDAAASALNIKTTKVELPLSHPTQLIDRIGCDSGGSIYAKVWAGTGSGTDRLPVREITPDGAMTKNFRVAGASRNTDAAKGIFVTDAGDVYQAARIMDALYVVAFARDGSVKSSTKLEADCRLVDPWQIAAFRSGGYLLSGLTGKDHRTPYTAVFDANGKLVKTIYEPEDEDARQKAESGDVGYTRSNAGNRFVGLGDVAGGSDGNVYLLRGTSPDLVYVISPAGEVVRKLHIDAGDPDFVAGDIKSYAGRLAIGFNGTNNLVVVTDLEGKTIARYTVDRHKPDWPALACYDSEGLTFATVYAERELYLLKAKLP
jgi:hypothetical protein